MPPPPPPPPPARSYILREVVEQCMAGPLPPTVREVDRLRVQYTSSPKVRGTLLLCRLGTWWPPCRRRWERRECSTLL